MKIQEMFLVIANMSLVASFIIGIVILARILLKKFPKIFSYILWIPVLFKLLIPFSFEGLFSLIPINEKSIPTKIDYSSAVNINTGITRVDNSVNNMITKTPESSIPIERITREVVTEVVTNPMETALKVISIIWIIGITFMVVRAIYGYIKLNKKLVGSIKYRDNIYLCDYIDTPFVVGIIKPKIYLPSSMEICDYIILHEEIHIRRRDNIIKILAYLALTIHWFNPLVWIAFILSTNDMEMSCDEAVVKEINNINADYAESLLNISTGRRKINAVSINFGEENTKERVKNIMKYKKAKWWKILLAMALSVVVLVGCFSGKKSNDVDVSAIINKEISGLLPTLMHIEGDNAAIYHKDFGIIVYDMKDEKITKGISYEKIIKDIKGDEEVSLVGVLGGSNISYLAEKGNNKTYDYSVEKNKLVEIKNDEEIEKSYIRENKYSYLSLKDNKNTFGDLELIDTDIDTGKKKEYKIFVDNSSGKKSKGNIDISDISNKVVEEVPYVIYGDKEKVYIYDEVMGMVVYDLEEKTAISRLKYEEISKNLKDEGIISLGLSKDSKKLYYNTNDSELGSYFYEYNIDTGEIKESKEVIDHEEMEYKQYLDFNVIIPEGSSEYKDLELMVYSGDEKTIYKVFGDSSDVKTYKDIEKEILGKKLFNKESLSNIARERIWLPGGPNVIYGDENEVIITGWFGVVVYDLEKEEVSRYISYNILERILPNEMSSARAKVSKDGTEIYFGEDTVKEDGQRPILSVDDMTKIKKFTHVYNVEKDTIEKISKQPKEFFENITWDDENCREFIKNNGLLDHIVNTKDSYIYIKGLTNNEEDDINIIKYNKDTKEEKAYIMLEDI